MKKRHYEQPALSKLTCPSVLTASGDPFSGTDNILDDDKIL